MDGPDVIDGSVSCGVTICLFHLTCSQSPLISVIHSYIHAACVYWSKKKSTLHYVLNISARYTTHEVFSVLRYCTDATNLRYYIYMHLLDCCAGGGGRQGDVEQLSLSSNDHAAVSSKLEVGSSRSSIDLANKLGSSIVDPDAITATNVYAALGVVLDTCRILLANANIGCVCGCRLRTIRDERWDEGESLAVVESAVLGNIKRVDGCRGGQVEAVVGIGNTGISNIGLLAIRGECDSVGVLHSISHNGGSTGVEVVTVHLLSNTRVGTEGLDKAVDCISEVEITVDRVDNKIIERVELATKEVVEKSYFC